MANPTTTTTTSTTRARRGNRGLLTFLVTLAIIGAINWGLIGFFNWNLVDAIFGGGSREQTSAFSRIIYALVGICGVILAFMLPRFYRERRLTA